MGRNKKKSFFPYSQTAVVCVLHDEIVSDSNSYRLRSPRIQMKDDLFVGENGMGVEPVHSEDDHSTFARLRASSPPRMLLEVFAVRIITRISHF